MEKAGMYKDALSGRANFIKKTIKNNGEGLADLGAMSR